MILLLIFRVLFVTTLNLVIVSIMMTGVVVAIRASCNIAVAAVTEVETLLSEVEALIVRAGQV